MADGAGLRTQRAIVHNGKLIIGTGAAGSHDPARRGNIEVVTYDLKTAALRHCVLHEGFELDDHDSPALAVLGDGRILVMYSKHGTENRIYYRISDEPGDTGRWQPQRVFVPSQSSCVTYSNVFRLADENNGRGRQYNFFRGYDNTFKPSRMTMDSHGQPMVGGSTSLLSDGTVLCQIRFDNQDKIHFVFTEGHPRDFDNSIYQGYHEHCCCHIRYGVGFKRGVRILFHANQRVFEHRSSRCQKDLRRVCMNEDIFHDAERHIRLCHRTTTNSAIFDWRPCDESATQGAMARRIREGNR